MAQHYGFTLDVKTSSGLLQMRLVVSVVMVFMLYSRGGRFAFVAYRLLSRAREHQLLFAGGCLAVVLFSCLNLLIIVDGVSKWIKFMKTRREEPAAAKLELFRQASDAMMAMGPRHGQAEWAKLRGVFAMGGFHRRDHTSHASDKKGY